MSDHTLRSSRPKPTEKTASITAWKVRTLNSSSPERKALKTVSTWAIVLSSSV